MSLPQKVRPPSNLRYSTSARSTRSLSSEIPPLPTKTPPYDRGTLPRKILPDDGALPTKTLPDSGALPTKVIPGDNGSLGSLLMKTVPKDSGYLSHQRSHQTLSTPYDSLPGTAKKQADDNVPPSPTHDEAPPQYPYPRRGKVALIMFSLYISIFLVALDRTIMGPAIPEITNQFHSLNDVGWYGSAYMLTACGFILLYGRVYTFFSTKWVFLSGILLFEAGSAVCGAAPSSLVLIIGRAIAGLGSSGIFTGAILIMLQIVPLHRRPMLQGLFGACFGVASVAGPLLGGAFTGSKATWRWCFYINLPLGAITVVVAILFVNLNETKPKMTWKQIFFNLDPFGTLLFIPSMTCLLLALEWGGTTYAWSEPRMIALLVVFAVLFLCFVALQFLTRRSTATVPARIVLQRSVAFGGMSQFFVGSTMLTVSIYLPIWFQAIKAASAMKSGIMMIPLVLSVVVGTIVSGGLVQRYGYYTPFMIFGSVCMAVGTGLLTTWNANTGSAEWIGYQVIIGIGVGSSMPHPNLAVQVVLPKDDIPSGTALLSFAQTLGGAIFVAVGQNVFIDKFKAALEGIHQIADPERIINGGATAFRKAVNPEVIPRIVQAYNYSLVKGTFFAALIVACLSFLAAIGMEWRSVKQGVEPRPLEENPSHSAHPHSRHSSIHNDEETNADFQEFRLGRGLTHIRHVSRDFESEMSSIITERFSVRHEDFGASARSNRSSRISTYSYHPGAQEELNLAHLVKERRQSDMSWTPTGVQWRASDLSRLSDMSYNVERRPAEGF